MPEETEGYGSIIRSQFEEPSPLASMMPEAILLPDQLIVGQFVTVHSWLGDRPEGSPKYEGVPLCVQVLNLPYVIVLTSEVLARDQMRWGIRRVLDSRICNLTALSQEYVQALGLVTSRPVPRPLTKKEKSALAVAEMMPAAPPSDGDVRGSVGLPSEVEGADDPSVLMAQWIINGSPAPGPTAPIAVLPADWLAAPAVNSAPAPRPRPFMAATRRPWAAQPRPGPAEHLPNLGSAADMVGPAAPPPHVEDTTIVVDEHMLRRLVRKNNP